MSELSMRATPQEDVAALYNLSIDEIEDRLYAMQQQENLPSYRSVDYLSLSSTTASIKSKKNLSIGKRARHQQEVLVLEDTSSSSCHAHRTARSNMCTWCFELADITNLSRLAVSRSMNYLDRFTASHPHLANDPKQYQLAAMTAMYIAVKLHEPLAMDAALLAEISAGCYTPQEILTMEKCILNTLEWRMNGPPTPQEYICLLLGLLNPEGYGYDLDILGSCLLDVAKFQCELAAADYDLSVYYKPSHVALASILNALDGILEEEYLLSCTARYAFLRRMCRLMPFVDMKEVGLVQSRLRLLFCQNNSLIGAVVEEDSDDLHQRCDEQQQREEQEQTSSSQEGDCMSSCCSSCNSSSDNNVPIKRRGGLKCTSPVSVS